MDSNTNREWRGMAGLLWRFYTDGWGADERHLDPAQHTVGKQYMQTIESQHINLRTRMKRLVRRTSCFSKTTTRHDLVIGLFMNRYEFGVAMSHGINRSETSSPKALKPS